MRRATRASGLADSDVDAEKQPAAASKRARAPDAEEARPPPPRRQPSRRDSSRTPAPAADASAPAAAAPATRPPSPRPPPHAEGAAHTACATGGAPKPRSAAAGATSGSSGAADAQEEARHLLRRRHSATAGTAYDVATVAALELTTGAAGSSDGEAGMEVDGGPHSRQGLLTAEPPRPRPPLPRRGGVAADHDDDGGAPHGSPPTAAVAVPISPVQLSPMRPPSARVRSARQAHTAAEAVVADAEGEAQGAAALATASPCAAPAAAGGSPRSSQHPLVGGGGAGGGGGVGEAAGGAGAPARRASQRELRPRDAPEASAAAAEEEDVDFESDLQATLGQVLAYLAMEGAPATLAAAAAGGDRSAAAVVATMDALPTAMRGRVRKLQAASQSVVQTLGIGFEEARLLLAANHVDTPQQLYAEVQAHTRACLAELEAANSGNPCMDQQGLRQWLRAWHVQYTEEVVSLLEDLAVTCMGPCARRKPSLSPAAMQQAKEDPNEGLPQLPGAGLCLPASVRNNKDAYVQGTWRKKPYAARAYEALGELSLLACSAQEEALLRHRLATRRGDGPAETFALDHCDLGPALPHVEAELVRMVRERQTLKLGLDVVELDTWGLDMYTRRNVFDALFEAGIFKEQDGAPPPPGGGPAAPGTAADGCGGGGGDAPAAEGAGAPPPPGTTQQHEEQQQQACKQPGPAAAPCGCRAPAGGAAPADDGQAAHADAVHAWIDREFLAAINHTGAEAFNMLAVCETLRREAREKLRRHGVVDPPSKPTSPSKRASPSKPSSPSKPTSPSKPASPPKPASPAAAAAAPPTNTAAPPAGTSDPGAARATSPPSAGSGASAVHANRTNAPASPATAAAAAAALVAPVQPGGGAAAPAPVPEQAAPCRSPCIIAGSGSSAGAAPAAAASATALADGAAAQPAAAAAAAEAAVSAEEGVEADGAAAAREVRAARRALACADAVEARVRQCGFHHFRVHPKGKGVQCVRPGGVAPFTLVHEYLGEISSPWRWWEVQEAIHKLTGEDRTECPDFYNILLERPLDDPAGYDVLYLEAAFKATFASRMAHSCVPNCQAVVVSAGGRLTIAMYTLRHIQEGEELTFDYASVTESEKEVRSAVCLCGSRRCRASYLTYLGASCFNLYLKPRHTALHRQAMLLRACQHPELDERDRRCLERHGFGAMALEQGLPGAPPCPAWLRKWAALALAFVERERRALPALLAALPPCALTGCAYTPASAQETAQSVMRLRLVSLVVALDKIKLFLRHQPAANPSANPSAPAPAPGPAAAPPLRRLTEQEVVAHLWGGERSILRRVIVAAVPTLLGTVGATAAAAAGGGAGSRVAAAGGGDGGAAGGALKGGVRFADPLGGCTQEELSRALAACSARMAGGGGGRGRGRGDGVAGGRGGTRAEAPPGVACLRQLLQLALSKVTKAEQARSALLQAERLLRPLEDGGGCHTLAADLLHLHACTRAWFACERNYKSFASPPVVLSDEVIRMHTRNGGGGGGGNGAAAAPAVTTAVATASEPPSAEPVPPAAAGPGGAGGDVSAAGGPAGAASDAAGAAPCGGEATGGVEAVELALPLAGGGGGDGAPARQGSGAEEAEAGAPADGVAAAAGDDGGEAARGGSGGGSVATAGGAVAPPSGGGVDVGGGAAGGVGGRTFVKRYGPLYPWAQLNAWYKQTVADPVAQLIVERRGAVSLPDVESAYATRGVTRYTPKERAALLEALRQQPDAPWRCNGPFAFRNEARVYGSPMLDDALADMEAAATQALDEGSAVDATAATAEAPGGDGTDGALRRALEHLSGVSTGAWGPIATPAAAAATAAATATTAPAAAPAVAAAEQAPRAPTASKTAAAAKARNGAAAAAAAAAATGVKAGKGAVAAAAAGKAQHGAAAATVVSAATGTKAGKSSAAAAGAAGKAQNSGVAAAAATAAKAGAGAAAAAAATAAAGGASKIPLPPALQIKGTGGRLAVAAAGPSEGRGKAGAGAADAAQAGATAAAPAGAGARKKAAAGVGSRVLGGGGKGGEAGGAAAAGAGVLGKRRQPPAPPQQLQQPQQQQQQQQPPKGQGKEGDEKGGPRKRPRAQALQPHPNAEEKDKGAEKAEEEGGGAGSGSKEPAAAQAKKQQQGGAAGGGRAPRAGGQAPGAALGDDVAAPGKGGGKAGAKRGQGAAPSGGSAKRAGQRAAGAGGAEGGAATGEAAAGGSGAAAPGKRGGEAAASGSGAPGAAAAAAATAGTKRKAGAQAAGEGAPTKRASLPKPAAAGGDAGAAAGAEASRGREVKHQKGDGQAAAAAAAPEAAAAGSSRGRGGQKGGGGGAGEGGAAAGATKPRAGRGSQVLLGDGGGADKGGAGRAARR